MKTKLKILAAACCTFLTFGAVANEKLILPGHIGNDVEFCETYAKAVKRIAVARDGGQPVESMVKVIRGVGVEPDSEKLMIKTTAFIYNQTYATPNELKSAAFSECTMSMLK